MKLSHLFRALAFLAAVACGAAACVLNPAAGVALEIEFSGRPVKRDIIALYDGRREGSPHDTRIHKFAEMPLNYLGYKLTYVDVNASLPDVTALAGYRGVLTWFVEPLRAPDKVVAWLDEATASGLKYVVLGEIAPPESDWLGSRINKLLARIGLARTGEYLDLTWRARVANQNPEVVGFERPLDKALPGFPVMRAVGSEAQPQLVIDWPSGSARASSIIVATAPGGGFASQSYTIFYEPNTDKVRWTLNPFTFFKRAFGEERFPIPDTTTLSGRRIYFSHIDGDGWNNVSEIERHREAQRTSAEVIAREAIRPYPDLPVSVGLIAGDIDPSLGGNPAGARVARELYALPQVEVASHSYSHPYNWQFFETYDRDAEVEKVEGYQPPDLTLRERATRTIMKLAKKDVPADRFDKYVAGSDDLPRTYLRAPFDLEKEVAGALKISESLAPPGKKARVYLWSGDTTPFPGAVRATRAAGVRNLNGGDSRLDAEFPSVTYVPPISRPAGAERQIYSGNSNENTYTNDWTGPYYGFFMLDHTLDNTDAPRRLKPFNLYYHMYSGEKPSALAAVRHFLDRARSSQVVPIAASHYAAVADDFFSTEVEQVDLFAWAVQNRGQLQTVRFDAADHLSVDLARSTGVLGSNRHAGALYVTLDESVPRAVVALRASGNNEPADAAQPASLVESRWLLSGYRREDCGFAVEATGWGPGDMIWQTGARRAFKISASRGDQLLSRETVWADDSGRIVLKIATSAVEPLTLRFECHD